MMLTQTDYLHYLSGSSPAPPSAQTAIEESFRPLRNIEEELTTLGRKYSEERLSNPLSTAYQSFLSTLETGAPEAIKQAYQALQRAGDQVSTSPSSLASIGASLSSLSGLASTLNTPRGLYGLYRSQNLLPGEARFELGETWAPYQASGLPGAVQQRVFSAEKAYEDLARSYGELPQIRERESQELREGAKAAARTAYQTLLQDYQTRAREAQAIQDAMAKQYEAIVRGGTLPENLAAGLPVEATKLQAEAVRKSILEKYPELRGIPPAELSAEEHAAILSGKRPKGMSWTEAATTRVGLRKDLNAIAKDLLRSKTLPNVSPDVLATWLTALKIPEELTPAERLAFVRRQIELENALAPVGIGTFAKGLQPADTYAALMALYAPETTSTTPPPVPSAVEALRYIPGTSPTAEWALGEKAPTLRALAEIIGEPLTLPSGEYEAPKLEIANQEALARVQEEAQQAWKDYVKNLYEKPLKREAKLEKRKK